MLLPGFSSARVPAHVRLFLSLALALALEPVVNWGQPSASGASRAPFVASVVGELLVGAFLGMMVRIFYLALEFAAAATANYAGYGSIFDQSIDDSHLSGPVAELITLTSLVLFFSMDLHLAVLAMLGASFDAVPAGAVGGWSGLEAFTAALRTSFMLSLQLSAPLLVYAMVLNVGLGLLNKLMPQVPIYFISAPFALAGGLVILLQSNAAMLKTFISGLGDWIERLPGLG